MIPLLGSGAFVGALIVRGAWTVPISGLVWTPLYVAFVHTLIVSHFGSILQYDALRPFCSCRWGGAAGGARFVSKTGTFPYIH